MRRLVLVALLAAVLTGAPEALVAARRPAIVEDHIPYGAKRKRQMARYSGRHYGLRRWRLRNPSVIVLHFTATSTYEPVRNHFASNSPARGEMPGVCTHFVVDKDGTIHQLVRLRLRCRHTVGLNHTAIGIEHVGTSDAQVMGNRRQRRASLRLTRWLRARHGIALSDVIGHAESLGSPHYREDVPSWRGQTHGDFAPATMRRYRRLLARGAGA